MENKNCQNCQNCEKDFIIESDDFLFYEKIKVPPPTFCPECRLQRRLAWRDEKGLFRRKCNAPGHTETIISVYEDNDKYVVYDQEYWNSDVWDGLDFGILVDFNKSFLSQFKELLSTTPLLALFDSKGVNNNYCNLTIEHKNCYMVSAGWTNEESLYSNRISFCKNTGDSLMCHKLDSCYECILCKDSNKLFFSMNSESCVDSYYLYDCRNCLNCIGCTNLRNKSYCIFNKQYTKEEYHEFLKENNLNDRNILENIKDKFNEIYKSSIHRYAHLIKTENVIGDNVENSRNCYYCFGLAGEVENAKYCNWGTYGLKDSYDTGPGTGGKSELTYEGISIGVANNNCAFGAIVWNSRNVYYSFGMQNCSNCFGCISLKNKSYCILNKQYSKEEYEQILPKLIEHMNQMPYIDKMGRIYKYGEFFPIEMSPYSYNTTTADDYMKIEESVAKMNNYPWCEKEAKENKATIINSEIPVTFAETQAVDLLKETLECRNATTGYDACTKAFRLTQKELDFYLQNKLPLPAYCFNCRHNNRIQKVNPLKLWKRVCVCNKENHTNHDGGCEVEFETSYAPDRLEKIYCEKCYQQEVY